jgi:hypothetical protein
MVLDIQTHYVQGNGMLKINLDAFKSSGLQAAFISALNTAIDRKDISTDSDGRLKTRATLRSIAGMMFYWNSNEVSIAGLIARKNGYDSDRLCLRGSSFVGLGADQVEEILLTEMSWILPLSKAQPKVQSDNLGNASQVLSACGL